MHASSSSRGTDDHSVGPSPSLELIEAASRVLDALSNDISTETSILGVDVRRAAVPYFDFNAAAKEILDIALPLEECDEAGENTGFNLRTAAEMVKARNQHNKKVFRALRVKLNALIQRMKVEFFDPKGFLTVNRVRTEGDGGSPSLHRPARSACSVYKKYNELIDQWKQGQIPSELQQCIFIRSLLQAKLLKRNIAVEGGSGLTETERALDAKIWYQIRVSIAEAFPDVASLTAEKIRVTPQVVHIYCICQCMMCMYIIYYAPLSYLVASLSLCLTHQIYTLPLPATRQT